MENIENTVDQLPIIDEVNRLLEQSFGRGTKGNYSWRRPIAVLNIDGTYALVSRLDRIMRKGWGRSLKPRGCFTDPDGSSLTLYDKRYLGRFEKYTELYEEKFGEKVSIREKNN